jgi:putative Holliday junction resolvase
MGYPLNMNGTLGPQSEYVLEFKKMLEEATNLEVILYDERLTTIEVQKVMISADVSRNKRKKVVDTLAATLILQSYLDSIR